MNKFLNVRILLILVLLVGLVIAWKNGNQKNGMDIIGTWELTSGHFVLMQKEFGDICTLVIDESFLGVYSDSQRELIDYTSNEKEIILEEQIYERLAYSVRDDELRLMNEHGELFIFVRKD